MVTSLTQRTTSDGDVTESSRRIVTSLIYLTEYRITRSMDQATSGPITPLHCVPSYRESARHCLLRFSTLPRGSINRASVATARRTDQYRPRQNPARPFGPLWPCRCAAGFAESAGLTWRRDPKLCERLMKGGSVIDCAAGHRQLACARTV